VHRIAEVGKRLLQAAQADHAPWAGNIRNEIDLD
jgi:hypothetical protein